MSAEDALVSNYHSAVIKAQAAAQGTLRVAVSPGRVAQAVRSLEGLDTGHLRSQASIAAGSSEVAGVERSIVSVVWPLLENLLGGIAGSALVEWVSSLLNQKDNADQVAADTCEAADAIDRINLDFSAGSAAILENLTASIDALVAFLESVSPQQNPDEFAATVAAMQELIDAAGEGLLDNCSNRDEAVGQCFDELIERGKTASCAPTPTYAPGVCSGEDMATGNPDCGAEQQSETGVTGPAKTDSAEHGDVLAGEGTGCVEEVYVQGGSEAVATVPAARGDIASSGVDSAVTQQIGTLGYQIGKTAGEFIGAVAQNLTVAGTSVAEGLCDAAGSFQAESEFDAHAEASFEAEAKGAVEIGAQREAGAEVHDQATAPVTAGVEAERPMEAEIPCEVNASVPEPIPEKTGDHEEVAEQEANAGAGQEANAVAEQEASAVADIPLDQRPEPAAPAEKLAHQDIKEGTPDTSCAPVVESSGTNVVESSGTNVGESSAAPAGDVAGSRSMTAHIDATGEAYAAGGVQIHKVGQWR